MREASHKVSRIVGFPLYEMTGIGKSIEREQLSGFVCVGRGGMGSDDLNTGVLRADEKL